MVSLMKSLCFSFIILSSLATLFSAADARRFDVGGSRGWVMNPPESYHTWAERNRFQVNDTLYFKYAKGSDSVQQVMKADYDGCNVGNPLEKFDNGETEVALNRSGYFYFISGNKDHCQKGQKLTVVVISIRHVPISPAKPPSTAQPPKAHTPVVPPVAPSTSHPPKSHSPVSPAKGPSTAEPPKAHSPVSPPAKAPKSHSPVSPVAPAKAPKSHSPVAPSKAPSSAHSPKAHSPVSPAAPAKAPATVQPPKANSPVSPTTPGNAPSKTPTPDHSPASPAPGNTPPSSPTPSQSTPADNSNAPAASPKSSASGVAVTSVMTKVLSVAFTVVMFA